MPKSGLVGPSYALRDINFSAQRSINLYPVISEVPESKDVSVLYGTPGLKQFADVGGGPGRGIITCANNRTFIVSGAGFYEVFTDGTSIQYGTISNFTEVVSMDENGFQVMIANTSNGYIFTFATNTFAKITDTDFPGANYVVFKDGYFIIAPPNNLGKFYISALYDGLNWDALDFATAESSPDGLVAPFSSGGQLLLFGTNTTEFWYNNGSADFPYTRLSAGVMQVGLAAKNSLCLVDNTTFFLGRNKDGSGIVYRINGSIPLRISTNAIEYAISKVPDITLLTGFSYQQEGHLFYVLTGVGLATSLVYDVSTSMWHERAYLDSGSFTPWLGLLHSYAFGKNITLDRQSSKVYQIDMNTHTDNGMPLKRTRVFTHIYDEGSRFKIYNLQVDFQGGVGLSTGQGINPLAWLRMSKDFGHTWSSEYETSIGPKGNYQAVANWRRMGVQKSMTFEVSISDPVRVYICGSTFNDDRQ